MSIDIYEILRYPHVTEKSTLEKEKGEGKVLTFRVRRGAKKYQIKEAVEKIFDVRVEAVRTANFQGKMKRVRKSRGRCPSWKKAYVTLRPGQKSVEFFENV